MGRIATWAVMVCGLMLPAIADDGNELLGRVLERMRDQIGRLPDYTCTQTVERRARPNAEKPWTQVDRLQLEVALVGGKELYAVAGQRSFSEKPLIDMVKKGTVSTGQFGLLAHHVFVSSKAKYAYKGVTERAGAPAHEWDYTVDADQSTYSLRTVGAESVVGFQGSFWADPQTLDLVRLDVQAYDIPDKLGMAEADTSLRFARVAVNEQEVLLPVAATLRVIATDAFESMNSMRLGACRQYGAESSIAFEGAKPEPSTPDILPVASGSTITAAGAVIEISLDADLHLDQLRPGDSVTARLARPLASGDHIFAPQGTPIRAQIVRLEKESQPFPLFELGLSVASMELDGRSVPVSATMLDAGPAAGLIREQRRMDPTFTAKRSNKMQILVREVQKGQGILHWDARKGALPRGLKMKWRLEDDLPLPVEASLQRQR